MKKPQPAVAAAGALEDDRTEIEQHQRPPSFKATACPRQRTHSRRMRRVSNLQFRDDYSIATDIDAACWVETYGGAVIGFYDIADRCGGDR